MEKQQEEKKFPRHLDHLNKTYLEELSYKFWVTKGARFKAHARLIRIDNLSSTSISYLTAYLIIFGLIGVYQSKLTPFIDPIFVNFGTTAGSILLLIFSQLESAKSNKLEAHKFHSCALEISSLYDELRMRKTLEIGEKELSDFQFCKQLDEKYISLLNKYPNHEDIDFKMFSLSKIGDYFPMNNWEIKWLPIRYYFITSALYHIMIVIPPLLLFIYFCYKY